MALGWSQRPRYTLEAFGVDTRMRTFGTRCKVAVSLDKHHGDLLKRIAKQEECSPAHALKWALRTLADKRGIKFSS